MEISLFASRMAEARKRFMRVTYPDGEIHIDFLTRAITNTTPRKLEVAGQQGRGRRRHSLPVGRSAGPRRCAVRPFGAREPAGRHPATRGTSRAGYGPARSSTRPKTPEKPEEISSMPDQKTLDARTAGADAGPIRLL
jgi:hypothetical protein